MINLKNNEVVLGSFRDPSGFLFWKDGVLLRQVNRSYQEHYDFLLSQGLYRELAGKGMLISHQEVSLSLAGDSESVHKVIKPEVVPFISYPYEWSFSQLKDAALLTLQIQKKALSFGMTLKDASAFNIQFLRGKPIFIDTLSFERYQEGTPWIAYRQFCQHFLAPLALMSARDVRLSQLFRIYLDGIPLDLAASLLPMQTKFSFGLLSHIHLHAKSQKYFANKQPPKKKSEYRMKKFSLLGLIDSLESTINRLQWQFAKTEWGEYYDYTNYNTQAFERKKHVVGKFLEYSQPKSVWDMGANTGVFSRIASARGIHTVAFDIDPAAVEKNYLRMREKHEANLLPLVVDLTNPSPALGWAHEERISLLERGPADTVLALALVHHLAISNNLPFAKIAHFFQRICSKALVIEFIPKNDSNAQRLLSTRKDIFPDYSQESFEQEFKRYFSIQAIEKIADSERILYMMIKTEPS